jgi:hypothetical protein
MGPLELASTKRFRAIARKSDYVERKKRQTFLLNEWLLFWLGLRLRLFVPKMKKMRWKRIAFGLIPPTETRRVTRLGEFSPTDCLQFFIEEVAQLFWSTF